MTGRGRRCAAQNARQDILAHWRGTSQARLAEVAPGKWEGPCPRCGQARGIHVEAGRNDDVVWAMTGRCGHSREDVFPMLRHRVPCAPDPGRRDAPALEAVKAAAIAVAANKNLTPSAKNLALLQVLGFGDDEALDHLGITDTGNRTRTRKALRRGMAGYSRPPAKTRSPAATVKLTAGKASGNCQIDSPLQLTEQPLTSGNTGLTNRATIVPGPAGTSTPTGTELDLTSALALLKDTLGAEVIASEHRPSPHPVADAIDTWTASEAGPCQRCGTTTCRYGDHGSALCPDCQPAEVRTPG